MKKKATTVPTPDANRPGESPSLALMREYNTPMTREEFLNLNYMGSVPDEIPPEDEAEFPEQFKLNPESDDDVHWDA
jgi:hypothetical protein